MNKQNLTAGRMTNTNEIKDQIVQNSEKKAHWVEESPSASGARSRLCSHLHGWRNDESPRDRGFPRLLRRGGIKRKK
jgi:hypothetical protein